MTICSLTLTQLRRHRNEASCNELHVGENLENYIEALFPLKKTNLQARGPYSKCTVENAWLSANS